MNRTLKALSALLAYPTAELQAAAPELRAAIEMEARLDRALQARLNALFFELATGDLYDLQERYLLLFDRTRSLSLHLFEHVHGESRDRGQAMIDLRALYERAGLAIAANELPDFLPMFLEFLATRPPAEAHDHLGETTHILDALRQRLLKRGSPYAAVFEALVALAPAAVQAVQATMLADDGDGDADPGDLAALDEAWEDKPVSFGPEPGGCRDDLIARLRAAKRPAEGRGKGAIHG
jgi:nitrate reductase delta subunit